MADTTNRTIPVSKINLDESVQCRVELDQDAIAEYAQAMEIREEIEPIDVYGKKNEKDKFYLADGWHRVRAAEKCGKTKISARCHIGDRQDAVRHALSANATHGVRRTNADKNNALQIAMTEFGEELSNRKIAELCAVSHTFVNKHRPVETDSSNQNKSDNQQPSGNNKKKPLSKFQVLRDKVDWAYWEWNPLTGCEHGCDYCYAKPRAEKYNDPDIKFKPHFYEDRLDAPTRTKVTQTKQSIPGIRNVLLVNEGDMWGDWVESGNIEKILEKCSETENEWNYLALTKNPERYLEFIDQIPVNVWLGATTDTQENMDKARRTFEEIREEDDGKHILYIACEPLLEEVKNIPPVDWVVLGAQEECHGVDEVQPEWQWIYNVIGEASQYNADIYWKPALNTLPKSCPNGEIRKRTLDFKINDEYPVYHFAPKKGIGANKEFNKKGLATHTFNVGFTCGHLCTYCSTGAMLYAQHIFRELGVAPSDPKCAILDKDSVKRIAENPPKLSRSDTVLLCSTVDAWSPECQEHDIGRDCLKWMLKNTDAQIRVLTKNAAVADDLSVAKGYEQRVILGLSTGIPASKDHLREVIEPYSSSIQDRLDAMSAARKAGLRTFGMLCPCFPGIADDQDSLREMFTAVLDCGCEHIWVEAVNPRGTALLRSRDALRAAGYTTEADAVDKVRKQENRSAYTIKLIRNSQKIANDLKVIDKLRFLLYPSNLVQEDKESLMENDQGVIWLQD